MSNEQGNQPPERTIDRMYRETGTPMWALEVSFDLLERGILDEDTIAGSKVVVHAAQVIAERSIDAATRMRDLCVEKIKSVAKAHRGMAGKFRGKALGEMQSIRAEECDILATSLQSLTLDNEEQEQK